MVTKLFKMYFLRESYVIRSVNYFHVGHAKETKPRVWKHNGIKVYTVHGNYCIHFRT